VCSELGSGVLDSLLLLGGDAGSNELEHLLLGVGESGDLSDDVSDGLNSLGDSTLSGDGSRFPGLFGGSSDDVTVVQANEDAASVVGFTHVILRL